MTVVGDVAAVVTALAAAGAAAGAYVEFVLKRSLLPSAECDVGFKPLRRGTQQMVGEVDIAITNAGQAILIVKDVRCRIVCRCTTDFEGVFPSKPTEPFFFHTIYPTADEAFADPHDAPSQPSSTPSSSTTRSAPSMVPSPSATPSAPSTVPSSIPSSGGPVATIQASGPVAGEPPQTPPAPLTWIILVGSRTFVQPGVTQHYRKPIVLPAAAELVHVWAAFDYRIELGRLSRLLIGWFVPPPDDMDWREGLSYHTVRRTVSVGEPPSPAT